MTDNLDQNSREIDQEPDVEDDPTLWIVWARRKMDYLESRVSDTTHDLVKARRELEDAKKQVESYETVIRSRARITVFDPGTYVFINGAKRNGLVQEVNVNSGNVVYYRVTWWDDVHSCREAWLHESEVSLESPLVPPGHDLHRSH
jgi:hypothetical protein